MMSSSAGGNREAASSIAPPVPANFHSMSGKQAKHAALLQSLAADLLSSARSTPVLSPNSKSNPNAGFFGGSVNGTLPSQARPVQPLSVPSPSTSQPRQPTYSGSIGRSGLPNGMTEGNWNTFATHAPVPQRPIQMNMNMESSSSSRSITPTTYTNNNTGPSYNVNGRGGGGPGSPIPIVPPTQPMQRGQLLALLNGGPALSPKVGGFNQGGPMHQQQYPPPLSRGSIPSFPPQNQMQQGPPPQFQQRGMLVPGNNTVAGPPRSQQSGAGAGAANLLAILNKPVSYQH